MRRSIMALLAAAGMLDAVVASAADSPVERGRTFAQANCAGCHAIGPKGESPLKAAPPFRVLHLRYPIEDLQESLAEGITTAHRAMPQFQFATERIGDLIAYLKSLEP